MSAATSANKKKEFNVNIASVEKEKKASSEVVDEGNSKAGAAPVLNLEEELERLSHEDLLELTESSVRRLVAGDGLLRDLPGDVTTEELLAQVAVVHGHCITVTVRRYSEKPLSVVIPQQGTTVRDLKKAVQRAFSLVQHRNRSRTKISWRYVWRAYNLQHQGQLLDNDAQPVSAYGVRNHSELRFVKRLKTHRNMLAISVSSE